FLEQIDAYK
nr:Chain C, peptide from Nucleoprotein [Feline coronavirus]7XQU_F Chain F, peptide from Nucleoprotein [Feline coronavirus]